MKNLKLKGVLDVICCGWGRESGQGQGMTMETNEDHGDMITGSNTTKSRIPAIISLRDRRCHTYDEDDRIREWSWWDEDVVDIVEKQLNVMTRVRVEDSRLQCQLGMAWSRFMLCLRMDEQPMTWFDQCPKQLKLRRRPLFLRLRSCHEFA